MINNKKWLFVIAIALWICSCVEPFNLNVKSDLRLLTIDATLTDTEEEQTITITESVNSSGRVVAFPVLQVKAELLVNGNQKIAFVEKGAGKYALPKTFQAKAGNSYQLFFTKSDGSKFESGVDIMFTTPEIIRVHDEFVFDGIEKSYGYDHANYVYLDTKDPANEQNSYVWSWQLWERQDVCFTCESGRYFETPRPGGCRREASYEGITYDYYCDGDCWEIFYSTELNVFSDIYTNGNLISNRLIAKIPFYNSAGALLEIKQQSVSPNAYRYLKLLAEQIQNNGSLVDTPPAALIGNIKNINKPEEVVAGFFMVTSVRYEKYWIDRKEPIARKLTPTGLREHSIREEPFSNIPGRPPLAPCILSQTRTPIKPKGWIK
ncbi:DUF4249 domain-containing protein [Emticicia sp. SJ17W-69]|uniref:DUF4249 domain-containing protein n=1 Tax=Emticicia sp. SJ17W-69 TaxID=3421657 RepID=UPI003EBE01FF